ncbi:MAG: bifunctional (p)ppGpp synthetase/guanosine-3',5'-bis(diphosphate) 3'-pyrophosphohydrolase [Clostridia bacterium]|nr:bifunctional (p)ppGpp synthetase/guanosine-3',5'-bis(diphosphate) 3'-pyrophosphohydrolase [Clostridia bacterium]
MIYTNATKKALKLCYKAHMGQYDYNDIPYVFHPLHIAEQMQDEDSTVVALLHDVVEDTDYTIDDLIEMGFNSRVIEAVRLLTHDNDVPYLDYLEDIKKNSLAKTVKIADILHNADQTRLDVIDDKAVYWAEKYKKALEVLGN